MDADSLSGGAAAPTPPLIGEGRAEPRVFLPDALCQVAVVLSETLEAGHLLQRVAFPPRPFGVDLRGSGHGLQHPGHQRHGLPLEGVHPRQHAGEPPPRCLGLGHTALGRRGVEALLIVAVDVREEVYASVLVHSYGEVLDVDRDGLVQVHGALQARGYLLELLVAHRVPVGAQAREAHGLPALQQALVASLLPLPVLLEQELGQPPGVLHAHAAV